MAKVGGLQLGVLSNVFDSKTINEKELIPFETKLQKAKDKVTLENNKLQAFDLMDGYLTALKSAAADLSSNLTDGAFVQRTTAVTTTDVGSGSDYFTATATSAADLGTLTVKVQQVATTASLTMGAAGGLLTGFNANNTALNANNITITPTIAGVAQPPVVVNLQNTDALTDVVTKINSNTAINGQVHASIIYSPVGNKYYLELKRTTTGDSSIAAAFNNFVASTAASPGVNAEVQVNGGAVLESTSNTIEVDAGITVQAIKANAGGNSQTILVKNNTLEAGNKIIKFFETWNEYAQFSATQQQIVGGKFADTAYLARTPELKEADNIINNILGFVSNANDINTLSQMGFELKDTIPTKEVPSYQEFTLNSNMLNQALTNNFDDVASLFQNKATITADNTNLGSILTFVGTNNQILSKAALDMLYPAGFPVNITIDGVGNVTNVTYITAGPNNAAYDPLTGNITFPGTVFEGLTLNIKVNGVVNHTEDFLFTFTQGIADKVGINLNTIINDDQDPATLQRMGSVDRAIEALTAQIDADNTAQASAQVELDKKQESITAKQGTLDILDLQLALGLLLLDELFNSNS